MFTGIIEETGRIISFEPTTGGWALTVGAGATLADAAVGDSIAVNGCCLTVTRFDANSFRFDVLEETRRLTNFSSLAAGARVNLERSLRFDGKIGGHFVTGHVDQLGTIRVFEARGADHFMQIALPPESVRGIVPKGSIAIDGVSLTVAEVGKESCAVWLIPHTLAVTNLGEKRVGDRVNLEFDLLGKYVERLLQSRTS